MDGKMRNSALENLKDELNGAHLYDALAQAEPDARMPVWQRCAGGITLFTGRSVLFSGTRQVLFGLAAAAVTFGIGRLIGVNVGG